MITRSTIIIIAYLLCVSKVFCQQETFVINDSLMVVKISDHVWQHISTDHHPDFGTFTSNGLIYMVETEALIFDTPSTIAGSEALLDWMKTNFKDVSIRGVVINHFHPDCLGGLRAFHNAGIPSYANFRTNNLLKSMSDAELPEVTFNRKLKIPVGSRYVMNYYLGAGHSSDNIVSWIPAERVLFGGCMIKSLGAAKGNLSDASLSEWPKTVKNVKRRFKEVVWVVPGHGEAGTQALLDYTVELFSR